MYSRVNDEFREFLLSAHAWGTLQHDLLWLWGVSTEKVGGFLPKSCPPLCTESVELFKVCGGCSDPVLPPGKALVLPHGLMPWGFLQITPKSGAPGPNLTPGSSDEGDREHPPQRFPARLVSLLGLQTTPPRHQHHLRLNVIYLGFFFFPTQFAIASLRSQAQRSLRDVCVVHTASFHTY